jgi:hypothetical protein
MSQTATIALSDMNIDVPHFLFFGLIHNVAFNRGRACLPAFAFGSSLTLSP